MGRPWHPIPIHDNGEPLVAIPPALLRGSPIPTKPLVPPIPPAAIRFSCAKAWWNVYCMRSRCCVIKPSRCSC